MFKAYRFFSWNIGPSTLWLKSLVTVYWLTDMPDWLRLSPLKVYHLPTSLIKTGSMLFAAVLMSDKII